MNQWLETSKLLKEKIVPISKVMKITGISRPTIEGMRDMDGNPTHNVIQAVYDYLMAEKKLKLKDFRRKAKK